MKRAMLLFILLFSMLTLFVSCPVTGVNDVSRVVLSRVRIAAVSSNGGDISFSVYPENSEGNIVNGAVVYVADESSVITYLDYNSNNASYSGYVTGSTSSLFRVNFISSGLGTKEITVKHKKLSVKPLVQVLRDSEGNSALAGNLLDGEKNIDIGWDSTGEDVTYFVQVFSQVAAVYSGSTKSLSVSIPPKTLGTGSYTLYITAQSIDGDATYKTQNYYSLSSIKSSGLSFNVK